LGAVVVSRVSLEERVAKIEGILEQMDRRLNHIESRVDHIESRVDSLFRWTMGTLITMWISIIGLLVMILMRL
jgi:CII-binding regulator of phage lambda lysogenization HflD